ncbi:ABC transporter domain-containing protein [Rozella allomycis CSF55]|uniref:ABC transporter domain-containing protein n=1 Tax=Rozella allomycis (strain CSF55) TaxID=988480 RepID=A0A075AQH7_ROZAC|nr:ABC transporter domain-containing protein [Rozella allomycis CSF55]|eukprot:EPZ30847.1 ABC transporter domain-containing protein [Rozella allomycis CSF55]
MSDIERGQQASKELNKDTEKKTEKIGFITLFRYADGIDKCLIFFGSLLSMGCGALNPFLFFYLSSVLEEFGKFSFRLISKSEFQTNISNYCLIFTLFGISVLFAGYFGILMFKVSGERQNKRIRELYLKALLRQDMGWHDSQQSGNLSSRLGGDLYLIQEGMSEKVALTLLYLAQFISGFVVAYIKGWQMALVLTAAIPVLVGFLGVTAKVISSFTEESQKSYGAAGALASEVLSSIRTVIAFQAQEKEANRYDEILKNSLKARVKRALLSGIGFAMVGFFIYAFIALGLWYGSTLISDGIYSGGNVVTVFFAFLIGAFSLGNLGPYISAFGNAQGAAFFVFNTIERNPLIDLMSNSGKRIENLQGNIEFKNVKFSYPSRPDIEVLHGINLQIPAGKIVAFCGTSGSGKSTIIQLAQRFYDPIEGQILVDGTDLKDLDLSWLHETIGIVSQEPSLFKTSIKQNIAFGKENATVEEINSACVAANALEFIEKLPKSLDSEVGERGMLLSGGQKQRIAIARALIKNPKILLLDEATSALDSNSEKIVQDALDNASKGRTTLIIAHRLSTIKNADMIVVMEHGNIMEKGTHEELLGLKGRYFDLVSAQSLASNMERLEKDETREVSKEQEIVQDTSKSVVESRNPNIHPEPSKSQQINALLQISKLSVPNWAYLLAGFLASSGLGVLFPLFSLYFGKVLAILFDTNRSRVVDEISFWALVFVFLGIASGVCNFLQYSMFEISGYSLTSKLRSMSFRAMMKQDVQWFDQDEHASSILTSKLSSEAEIVQSMVGSVLGQASQALVNTILGAVIALVNGWKLALVLFCTLPLYVVGIAAEVKANIGSSNNKEIYQESSDIAGEVISNVRTVTALNKSRYFLKKYHEALKRPFMLNIKSSYISSFGVAFSQAMQFFVYAISYYYGAIVVADGEITFENMNIVIQSVFFMTLALGQASAFLPNFRKGIDSTNNIFEIVNSVPKIEGSKGSKLDNPEGNINLQKVTFRYPNRPEQTVLKSVSLDVKQGQTIGLVGSSGSGKSTILQLVLRFYDINKGELKIDAKKVNEVDIRELRSIMSIVSQEPVLFARSIKDNIGYAKENATMEEIVEAAKNANIHEFIESLPQKYDSYAGEKGTQLSGGQKQRIAIARAILKNPKILLLDEATSALDTESEKVVQAALDKASKGRTTLVIAHRLSTIKNSDCIFVMKDGQVVEVGNHDELLNLKGLYYDLVQKQTINQ